MTEPVLWDHMLTGRIMLKGQELIGDPQSILPRLRRSAGRYAREYKLLYVGRTKDPWSRMAAHQKQWEEDGDTLLDMIKVYRTSSFACMVKVEANLIEHIKAEARQYGHKVLNRKYGDWQESSVFYLYMLVDDGSRKNSLSTTVDWDQMQHEKLASQSMKAIKNLIKENAEDQKYVYVGFTDDPDRRFYQHQRIYEKSASWSKMIVLFEGSNLNDTYVAENTIIDFAQNEFGLEKCLNAKQKYEPDERQPYFIYVLGGE